MKGKRVEITPQIDQWIKAAVGDIDTSKIAVFEAVAASTRPIKQKRSMYDGAVMATSLLQDMADFANAGEVVPLQVMHMTYAELPKGKVFRASVEANEDGFSSDLVTLFYIPLDSEELLRDIDLGLVDEVSVGALSKKALCSECGYDYFDFSNESAEFNLWMRTCDNEHQLGVDGVHLNLVGLDTWSELSLVGKGASNKAKIRGAADQTLSKETRDRLAANGVNPDHLFLHCSASEGESIVDANKLIDEVTNLKAAALVHASNMESKDTELTAASELNVQLKAQIDELTAKVEELTASDVGTQLAETQAQLTTVTAERDTAVAFVVEQAKLATVAADGEAKDFDDLESAQAAIQKSALKLHQLVPAGGAAVAGANDLAKPQFSGNSAFKSARR